MTATATAQAAPLSVTRQATIHLAPRETWRLISGFGHVHDWHPAVAGTQITEGIDNVPGAVRKLTSPNGGTLDEQLTAHDPVHMRLAYKITAGAFPASAYSSEIRVEPASSGNASVVTWQGRFLRADASGTPAAGQDDQAAIEAVTSVYESGLQSLQAIASDKLAIERVIGFYSEGGTHGDAATVARAFHPSASMKFIKNGAFVDEPIAAYFKNYIPAGVQQHRTVRTDYIDVRGTAASARLTIDYPTHQFIDYFNLLKQDGEWLIVSKIFHRIAK